MKRILVINDSQELLELFHMILEGEGYEVISYSYALETMEEIERIKPDLIILDFMIGASEPKGWDMLQKLKLFRTTEAIPVIVCTAAERTVFEQQGYLASKGVSVVLKPFNIDDLLHAVSKAFSPISSTSIEQKMREREEK